MKCNSFLFNSVALYYSRCFGQNKKKIYIYMNVFFYFFCFLIRITIWLDKLFFNVLFVQDEHAIRVIIPVEFFIFINLIVSTYTYYAHVYIFFYKIIFS